MCGRARSSLGRAAVRASAGRVSADSGTGGGSGGGAVRWVNEDAYAPRHNATPGAPLAVLRCAAPSDDDAPSSPRAQPPPLFSIETMRWGLVPAFTPPTSAPDFFARFNARSESARDKASFRRLVPARRCVALLDGFYEWTALGTHSKSQSAALGARSPRRTKQPWLVRPSSDDASSAEGVMYVAGLWDEWVPSTDSAGARADKRAPVRTFTILTTAPAEGLAWLHDRQPVVLRSEAAAREWLRRGDRPDVYARLTRGTAEGLTYHMVNPAIGKASEWQGPEACAPYTPPKPKRAGADIRGFFSAAPSPKRRAGGREAHGDAQQQEEEAPPKRAKLEREH